MNLHGGCKAQVPQRPARRARGSSAKRHDHPAPQRQVDALELLAREHQAIRRHFRDYPLLLLRRGDAEEKAAVVGRICDACCLHLQLKDELLYPIARLVLGEDALLAQVLGDHARCLDLIAKLDEMEPKDAEFDAAVTALAACLLPYFDAERQELFPKLRSALLDLGVLGRQLAARRRVLQADITRLGATAPAPCVHSPAGDMTASRSARLRTDHSQTPVLPYTP